MRNFPIEVTKGEVPYNLQEAGYEEECNRGVICVRYS